MLSNKLFINRFKIYVKLCFLRVLYVLNSEQLYRVFRFIFFKPINTLVISLDNVCNYNCTFCKRNRKKCNIEKNKWIELIKEIRIKGIKDITIVGGEPLLYPALFEVLNEIKRLNFHSLHIVTNGSLLTDDNIDRLKPYNPTLVVKYGIQPSLYQEMTGQTRFNLSDIESNIAQCVKNGLPVVTFSVIKRFNMNYVDDIIHNTLRLGAFPAFQQFYVYEKLQYLSEKNTVNEVFLSSEEFKSALKPLDNYFLSYKDLLYASLRLKRKSVCGGYDDLLYINCHGYVFPCPYCIDEEYAIGNILDDKFDNIYKRWLSSKRTYAYGADSLKCKKCFFRYLCRGGCLALRENRIDDNAPCLDSETYIRQIGYFLAALEN